MRFSCIPLFDGRWITNWGIAILAGAVGVGIHSDTGNRLEAEETVESVDFATQIRPLLANACYHCHGPDEENRESDLRLDSEEEALLDLGGYAAVVPRAPESSELLVRMLTDDEDLKMPPSDSGKHLDDSQIALFRTWIAQGAPFENHWAFETPMKTKLPVADQEEDPHGNPIDAFVRHRLQSEPLAANPQANRITLIRRLSLDLIGLLPTPHEVDDFVNDSSPEAYDKLVERLLGSQHHGEHWARSWLDAARYSDSDGYEKDKPRFVHAYRDWVVRALNQDMPYDQFIIKQIAGDLLPDATSDDRVATGFLRNSMINEEGGADVEQFRMEAMFDRMDTVGKSVLGLTIHCCQCHSHKYDALSQSEYYSLFAMLNNCDESCIAVYAELEQTQMDQVHDQLTQLRQDILDARPELLGRIKDWVASVKQAPQVRWVTPELDYNENTIGGQKYERLEDGSYLAQGYSPTKANPQADAKIDLPKVTAIRIELLQDPNLPRGGPGRSVTGEWAITEFKLYGSKDGGKIWNPIKLASAFATVNPPKRRLHPRYFDKKPNPKRVTGGVDYLIDGTNETAWTGTLSAGYRNEPQTAFVQLAEPMEPDEEHSLRLRFEVMQRHGGWNSDDNQTQNVGRMRLSVTDDDRATKHFDDIADPLPPVLRQRLGGVDAHAIDPDQELFASVLEHFLRITPELDAERREFEKIWESYPEGSTQLILSKRERPRQTYRLRRGDFLSPAEKMEPGFPEVLHDPSRSRPVALTITSDPLSVPGRLDLAYWLVDRKSPTTARAIVNRVWQSYFGIGIVSTPGDLGLQGDPPSHRELLDWLAVDLMEHNWSLKHLHRTIVDSTTYQQSSKVDPDQIQLDPSNRLLSRGPRFRVAAEVVRDIALGASGLLNLQVGGVPVYPPAPSFLFEPPASYGPKTWSLETDAQKYRRALYTFRFRSVPYPVFQAFDAPTGEVSCIRRSLSNTPLQALTTLNEPLFFECAQSLGSIAMATDGKDQDKIHAIFGRCVARRPTEDERNVLLQMLDQQRKRMINEPERATELTSSPADRNRYEVAEHAAWTTVSRVILNLDETITKN